MAQAVSTLPSEPWLNTMLVCIGARVFRLARPNALVQTTSPFRMQETTAPGVRYRCNRAGIRSSKATANGSAERASPLLPARMAAGSEVGTDTGNRSHPSSKRGREFFTKARYPSGVIKRKP